ncbi:SH3 domain-containing protein [Christensenellaceae bacterium OttesenSCG-928-M15]|nr:SH3 domain-containing protein [Christensenellaceae bacterium OttesenSCG-928-M15]
MRKKLLCILLCVCMAAGAFPAAAASGRTFGVITADEVNLRKDKSTDSQVLLVLPLNAEVEVLSEEGNWYRILYNDVVGYVRQDYVFVSNTGSRAAYVLEDGVKLRGGAAQSAYVVAELSAGQGVKVKHMVGDWYFVVAGDQVGYVHRSYLTMTKATNAASSLLRTGMEGQEVKRLQEQLRKKHFLASADVTGTFGAKTREAVQQFQKACGFEADGIVGAQTLQAIYDPNNKLTKTDALTAGVKGNVELLDWFKGGNEWLARYSKFQVMDVKTGITFNVRRFGGWYHADSEPLTAEDTKKFKQIVNGKWTWDRRAIWVIYKGRAVAASMNCMPHLVSPTKSNNFPGHFCIHLYKSKVHENSKECPRHQAKVQAAYKAGK